MNKLVLIVAILLSLSSCSTQRKFEVLSTVIKLQSAESMNNLEEAQKYIDVDKTYNKISMKEGKPAFQLWKEYLNFSYSLAQDKKFTNNFAYFEYDIKIKNNKGKYNVYFNSSDTSASFKSIQFSLDKLDNQYKVVNINFVKW